MHYPHPDYLLEEIDSPQLTEWLAYNKVEPFGHDALFFLLGQIASLLYNKNRGPNTTAKGPWDFIPFMNISTEKQSTEGIKGLLMALVEESDDKPKKIKKNITTTKRLKKRRKQLKQKLNERKNSSG